MLSQTLLANAKRFARDLAAGAPALVLLAIATSAGCLSYQIEEPAVCKTNVIQYQRTTSIDPSAAAAGTQGATPLVSDSVVNLADVLATLGDLGSLEFGVTQNRLTALSGDFSWIQQVTIQLAPVDESSPLPPLLISQETVDPQSTTQDFHILADSAEILPYIQQGQAKFVVTMVPRSVDAVPESFQVNHTFCANVTVTGEKKL